MRMARSFMTLRTGSSSSSSKNGSARSSAAARGWSAASSRSRSSSERAETGGMLLVPHDRGAVASEDSVLGREREPFGERLGHQDAVEGILVKLGQARQGAD